jgi:hypothetical protein
MKYTGGPPFWGLYVDARLDEFLRQTPHFERRVHPEGQFV